MKKRLLSAVLALAMMLTLLPVSVFAAEYQAPSEKDPISHEFPDGKNADGTPKTKKAYDVSDSKDVTVTVSRCTSENDGTKRTFGDWYWLDNLTDPQNPVYYKVTSGIIVGNNGSGKWYENEAAFVKTATNGQKSLRSNTFTILGDTAVDMSSFTIGAANSTLSLTVDIEGKATFTPPANTTSLTVTCNKWAPQGIAANMATVVFGASVDHSAYVQNNALANSAITMNLTNVKIAAIDLKGRANSVTLTDCVTTGGITMDGETATNATTGKAYNNQTLKLTRTTVGGDIEIKNADLSGNPIQLVDVTSTASQVLKVEDCNGSANTISISGKTVIGAVTSKPRTTTGTYPGVKVTNLTGGSVASIEQKALSGNNTAITIEVSGANSTITGDITMLKGTTTIDSANVGGDVIAKAGTLNIKGANVKVGDVVMGESDTLTLNMTATGSVFDSVKAETGKGGNVIINSWTAGRYPTGNNYGELDLDTYKGGKVTGGTFAAASAANLGDETKLAWFDTANLQFFVKKVKDKVTTYDLYLKTELARAISDVTTTEAAKTGTITVLGQTAASGQKYIKLQNGGVLWAQIAYKAGTPMIMPERINNVGISNWIAVDNDSVNLPAGTQKEVPCLSTNLVLDATGVIPEIKRITKAGTAVASATGTPVQNQNVTVTLNNNNINITGAVTTGAGGLAEITLDLETDVVNKDGTPIKLEGVVVNWNVNTKTIQFYEIQPASVTAAGVVVQNGALVLNNGTGARYTVSGSLTKSAPKLEYADGVRVQATLTGTLNSQSSPEAKKDIIDALTGGSAALAIGADRAFQQAINAAQATITTDSTVDGWIATAKNNIWRNGFKSPDSKNNTANDGYMYAPNSGSFNLQTTNGGNIASSFSTAYIVPYLVVEASYYDATSGILRANLKPYYRVDVSGSSYDEDIAYTVQQGRALNLTGEMSTGVTVTLNLPDAAFTGKFMHQDGKYVYPESSGAWTITHTGANGTLGAIEINGVDGLISLDDKADNKIDPRVPAIADLGCTYDDLQAAIDDTVPGVTVVNADAANKNTWDTIVIDGNYTKDCTINMTGIARKVVIVANGQQKVTTNNLQNVSVQGDGDFTYIVELKRDVVAAGTVALSAQGTNQGSVSLPATSAKVGQTVTVTVVPNAGQTSTGVTVKTNAGTTVNATSTGRANEYSFVVPTGATSVTVTPNFAASATAVFAVSSNTVQGTARAITGSDGKALQGDIVPVTVQPNSGYRTMDLTARGNNGANADVKRTGNDTFNVTVPSGATTVTLYPSFDINNGTPFKDVLASHWASSDISWVYSKNYSTGYGSQYEYKPDYICTKWELVTFLWKSQGYPDVTSWYANPFKDVTPTYPDSRGQGYKAILWAASQGIIDTSSGYFQPTASISRADTVLILYNHAKRPTVSGTSGFADVASNAYYAKAVTWARQKGLTKGYSGSTYFRPSYTITRAEVAAFLHRAFG